jgi:hypothetical protein
MLVVGKSLVKSIVSIEKIGFVGIDSAASFPAQPAAARAVLY